MKRRIFIGALASMGAAGAVPGTAGIAGIAGMANMAAVERAAAAGIPQRAASRVIVDNDFAGDPDGLFALAHQLLSPKARTVLVTTSALDAKLAALGGLPAGKTAAAGTAKAEELIDLLGLQHRPVVVTGAESFGSGAARVTAAARAIVAEAMRDDPLPLFVTCGGPLTNVAAALRLQPAIASRMTLVWIGGSAADEGGAEYNLSTDIGAARQVLEASAVPVWQVPDAEYRRFQVSIAELASEFAPISPVAQWLCSQYQKLPPFVQLGGALTLGDSAMVSMTAFGAASTPHAMRPVRRILDDSRYGDAVAGRQVRVCHGFDTRLNLADFKALLRLGAGRQ